MQNIIFSVDWIQYSCDIATEPFIQVGHKLRGRVACGAYLNPVYNIVQGKEFNAHYAASLCVMFHGFPVAHCFYLPRRADIDPRRCVWKAGNRLLYMQHWADTFHDIIICAGCVRVYCTRIDLCADFNRFKNGLHPREFIQRYFSPATKCRPSYIRHSSNKFRTFGQKNTFDDGRAPVVDFQTLSFGTRDSAVQTNLYNKSEELRQKDKPYIRQMWIEAGLNPDDVWRVEFSLNSRGLACKHLSTGMIADLSANDLALNDYLTDAFLCYAEQYFSFHLYYKGDTRGLRSLPLAQLFERPRVQVCKPVSFNLTKDSGRTEVVCYKLLERLYWSYPDATPDEIKGFKVVLDKLSELASVKKALAEGLPTPETFLEEWARAKESEQNAQWAKAYGRRLHRVVQQILASDAEEVQLYKEAFDDFFVRLRLDKVLDTASPLALHPATIAQQLSHLALMYPED